MDIFQLRLLLPLQLPSFNHMWSSDQVCYITARSQVSSTDQRKQDNLQCQMSLVLLILFKWEQKQKCIWEVQGTSTSLWPEYCFWGSNLDHLKKAAHLARQAAISLWDRRKTRGSKEEHRIRIRLPLCVPLGFYCLSRKQNNSLLTCLCPHPPTPFFVNYLHSLLE